MLEKCKSDHVSFLFRPPPRAPTHTQCQSLHWPLAPCLISPPPMHAAPYTQLQTQQSSYWTLRVLGTLRTFALQFLCLKWLPADIYLPCRFPTSFKLLLKSSPNWISPSWPPAWSPHNLFLLASPHPTALNDLPTYIIHFLSAYCSLSISPSRTYASRGQGCLFGDILQVLRTVGHTVSVG